MTDQNATYLTLGCIFARGRALEPGERRFLAQIAAEPRLKLRWVSEAEAPPAPLPGVLKLETRVFPAPDCAPQTPQLPDNAPEPVDVVVDFSHGDEAETLSALATHGLWRLSSFAPFAGWGEALDLAGNSTVRLTTKLNGQTQVVASARYDTKFFATRNQAFMREKSVQLLSRELVRLAMTGEVSWSRHSAPTLAPFTGRQQAGYAGRTLCTLATRALRKIGEKAGARPGMFYLRLGDGDVSQMTLAQGVDLMPPPGTYWADPFLYEHDGRLFCFYEVYDYRISRGYLAVGEIEGDEMREIGPVMQMAHHLSYPNVFEWGGEIYMLPETNMKHRVELWRATDFPTGWEMVSTGLEGMSPADSVMFEKDGQWWLLSNLCQDSFGDFGTELHAFAIDSPMMNEVTPHPLNPVVIDACTARGGGRVFTDEAGRLMRMSQDNSNGVYGYGLNFMEVTELGRTAYAEERRRHIVPDDVPGVMGVHHLDAAGGRHVFDLRRAFWQPFGRRRKQGAARTADRGLTGKEQRSWN